jgi:hypothetical protein
MVFYFKYRHEGWRLKEKFARRFFQPDEPEMEATNGTKRLELQKSKPNTKFTQISFRLVKTAKKAGLKL